MVPSRSNCSPSFILVIHVHCYVVLICYLSIIIDMRSQLSLTWRYICWRYYFYLWVVSMAYPQVMTSLLQTTQLLKYVFIFLSHHHRTYRIITAHSASSPHIAVHIAPTCDIKRVLKSWDSICSLPKQRVYVFACYTLAKVHNVKPGALWSANSLYADGSE